MKKAIAMLLAVLIVSSALIVFAIAPASSEDTHGEVATNFPPTIQYETDAGSTYRDYTGYSNDPKYRYTWEGDIIQLKVGVTDENGLGDIETVELYINGLSRDCTVTNETISNTSAYYTLTYTVQNTSLVHGEQLLKVKVTDKSGACNDTGTEIDTVWFNPVVSICASGSIRYLPGDPGNINQSEEAINSTFDCGSPVYGSDRNVCIDNTCLEDDERADYNWTMRVKNAAEGNVFLELNVSGTDMTGDTKGGIIPVTNQHFYMNSSRGTTKGDTALTETPKPVVTGLRPDEYCYFDFYLKYPAVPKDTYSGEINLAAGQI